MNKMSKKIIILLILFISFLCINVKAETKSGWVTENNKTYYYDKVTGKKLQWWHKDEGGLFYLQYDGSVKEGLQEINGVVYYVKDHYIQFGEHIIDGLVYSFTEGNGELKYGSVRLENEKLMLIDKAGNHFKNGWIIYENNIYYQKNGYLVEGFEKIDGKTYYFEKDTGKRKQWWQKDENGVFYLQYDGSVTQGLQFINGILYYVKDNYIQYGEYEINGKTYVFNEGNGELKYGSVRLENGNLMLINKNGTHYNDGWVTLNGDIYYQKDGILLEGFNDIDGKRYYLEKGTGKRKQWWQHDEIGNFYLNYDGSIKQGLQEINGVIYYIENDHLYCGEKTIEGKPYVFNEGNGELKYGSVRLSNNALILVDKKGNFFNDGWITYNGDKYYQVNGALLEGFNNVGNKRYYFETNTGKIKQWWQKDASGVFYLQYDGSINQGLQVINGIYYYIENDHIYYGEKVIDGVIYEFNQNNGEMIYGLFTDSLGNIRYVTKDGKRPTGWLRPQGTSYIYYITNDGTAAVGIVNIEGRSYQFGADGVLWGFYNKDGKMYYKDPDGTVVKGIQYIAGFYYQFNSVTGAFEKIVRQVRVIDVSHNNGHIDWNQVKASGLVDGAILRIGYGSAYLDNEFIYNKNECERLGIPYSVYLFSYADNKYDSLNESNFLVKQVLNNNVHINTNMFSIYYDLEDWEIRNTIYNSYGISQDTYRDMINTFINNTEQKLCIKTRVYASTSYIYNRFPQDTWDKSTWVADWRGYIGYTGAYEGWQYTNSGYVPGINGVVDISLFYY